ncbi:hypothetical protein F0562_019187 [Nyssa sinensis]|uniref:Thioesterase domain-containing protein n=1 Tax=Nyssa sinensis TaxID=561372 RepID=A0A5J4ZER8_9ASTE|nr:hypothetical protein F0562_019187 [Nyssa sinensis]
MGKEKPSTYLQAEMASSANTIPTPTICRDVSSQNVFLVNDFFDKMGTSQHIPQNCDTKDFYTDLIRGALEVNAVQRGRISCLVSVKPPLCNAYGGLHGGSVGALAEIISTACARTVVGEGKELFLGELSISYLSAAPRNAKLKCYLAITCLSQVCEDSLQFGIFGMGILALHNRGFKSAHGNK